ncbi:RNA polymerase sigma factor [Hymenobacter sp. B81]|uniref:RNA polymerase sigma factor n=1 Tax=Hymenobacter sp. B81 TaxID=3344878 RepID=UPI0037DD78BB
MPFPTSAGASGADETDLVQRLYARDEAAMTLFYDCYGRTLFHFIVRIVRNPLVAEDVLQESMVKIWFAFGRYDAKRGRLFTWALNVCRNQALDTLRTQAQRLADRTGDLSAATGLLPAEPTFVPDHCDVRACLHHLRPAYRRIIELRYFTGLSQEEVAEELGLPLGTVKTQNRAALRQLATLWR